MKPALVLLLPLISAACLILAGCSTGTGGGHETAATSGSMAALENVDLKCVRLVVQGTAVTVPSDAGITLRVTGAGKVAGRAAVNRYFGAYTLAAPGQIEWTPFGTTRMAGPAELMKLEDEYLQALARTTRVNTAEHGLIFQSADGSDLVELVR